MEILEIQKIVKQIKKSLFKKFSSHGVGLISSQMRGMGLQFKEHKVYAHGDDVRFIDWKIFAKTQGVYVKTFEQERALHVLLIIDTSPSMSLGYLKTSKLQAALEIAFLLFFLSEETKDKIEVVLLGDKVRALPRATGRQGLIALVAALKKLRLLDDKGQILRPVWQGANREMSTEEKWQFVQQRGIQRKQMILLSDFLHFLPLAALAPSLQKQSTRAFQILSPLEKEKTPYPYSVFGQRLTGDHESTANIIWPNLAVNFFMRGKKRSQHHHLPAKIKKIFVQENYLHNFVREMMK